MIRARGDGKNGRPLIVLGVDAENLRRLKEGDPLFVDGAAYGLGSPVDLFVFFGESPGDLVATLEKAGVLSPEGLAALKGQLPS